MKLMEPLTESHYMPSLAISSTFDGGNITCIAADSPDDIRLKILKDNRSDFYQWFYFRLTGACRQTCKLHITNAGKSAYTKGWEGYNAVASDDRQTWRRVPTSYKNGVLTIEYTPQTDAVWFAYFAPYTMERHYDLIAPDTEVAARRYIGFRQNPRRPGPGPIANRRTGTRQAHLLGSRPPASRRDDGRMVDGRVS